MVVTPVSDSFGTQGAAWMQLHVCPTLFFFLHPIQLECKIEKKNKEQDEQRRKKKEKKKKRKGLEEEYLAR